MDNRALKLFGPGSIERAVYLQMCSEAEYNGPTEKWSQGVSVPLNNGQLIFGRRAWAEKFGVSEGVIRGAVDRLLATHLINQMRTGKNCVVTIAYLADKPDANRSPTADEPQIRPISKTEDQRQKTKDKDLVAGAPKKLVQELDWSPLNLTPEHIDAVKAIRKKHGSKGKVSQRVITTLSQEFAKARAGGLSDEQIVSEWDTRGWVAIRAEWLLKDRQQGQGARPSRYEQQIAARDAMNARFLAGAPQEPQHQRGYTYEHE
ncbi:hypothetical protein ACK3YV_07585 [Aeromonas caviae]